MNKEFILELFYSKGGRIDEINDLLDNKYKTHPKRKISIFEKFIKSRIHVNSKILKMAKMEITPPEAVYLSLYPDLESVEFLDLRKNHIGDEGFQAIAQSPVLKNLKVLDLRNNQITRKGILTFIESQNFSKLETLDLRTNQLASTWGAKIKKMPEFPCLKEVRIL